MPDGGGFIWTLRQPGHLALCLLCDSILYYDELRQLQAIDAPIAEIEEAFSVIPERA
jgi:hypothetical protein